VLTVFQLPTSSARMQEYDIFIFIHDINVRLTRLGDFCLFECRNVVHKTISLII